MSHKCTNMTGLAQKLFVCLTAIAATVASEAHAQGIITTIAGNGREIRGVSGPASSASIGSINGIAVDAAGNIYASDRTNHQIVRISTAGTLTIIAGNGLRGYSGDGGQAANASLNSPKGLALDAAGNLYIADQFNYRIRQVSPSLSHCRGRPRRHLHCRLQQSSCAKSNA